MSFKFNKIIYLIGFIAILGILISTASLSKTLSIKQMNAMLMNASIDQINALMNKGELRSQDMVRWYTHRVYKLDKGSFHLNAVIQLNPDAMRIAKRQDKLMKKGIHKSRLQGISIYLKDNMDTKDKLLTTAGSFSLLGSEPK